VLVLTLSGQGRRSEESDHRRRQKRHKDCRSRQGDRAADESLDADTIQVREAAVGLVKKGDYRQNEAAPAFVTTTGTSRRRSSSYCMKVTSQVCSPSWVTPTFCPALAPRGQLVRVGGMSRGVSFDAVARDQ